MVAALYAKIHLLFLQIPQILMHGWQLVLNIDDSGL